MNYFTFRNCGHKEISGRKNMLKVKSIIAGRVISDGKTRHLPMVKDSWELIFVLKQNLELLVDQNRFTVLPRQCLLIPPGTMRGNEELYPRDLSYFWIHFTCIYEKDNAALQKHPPLFPVFSPERLSSYFQLFLSLQAEKDPDHQAKDAVMSLILHEAMKPASDSDSKRDDTAHLPPVLKEMQKIINTRFKEKLSTAIIARELHCNPDYLGRCCQKYLGHSLTYLLNTKRLRYSITLLTSTALPISQVAYQSGYNDIAYFRRQFFRFYAMTPHNYRKLHTGFNYNV